MYKNNALLQEISGTNLGRSRQQDLIIQPFVYTVGVTSNVDSCVRILGLS